MPLAADANLDRLYRRQRMLEEEADRLDVECGVLAEHAGSADKIYVFEVAALALREESTKVSAQISNILDRDLQR